MQQMWRISVHKQTAFVWLGSEGLQLPAEPFPVSDSSQPIGSFGFIVDVWGTGPARLASSKCHDFTADHGSSGVRGGAPLEKKKKKKKKNQLSWSIEEPFHRSHLISNPKPVFCPQPVPFFKKTYVALPGASSAVSVGFLENFIHWVRLC